MLATDLSLIYVVVGWNRGGTEGGDWAYAQKPYLLRLLLQRMT